MLRLETIGTKTVEDFLNGSENQCESTAKEYRKRLELFAKFVQENYDSLTLDELIETLTKEGRGPRIDIYQLAINYIAWLKRRGTMTPRSIKTWVSTARHYLESMDVEISPRKWQLRVKTPKVVRSSKESLSKDDIQTILNACDSIRLTTWLFWLAATGCRATESLSVRLCDINWKTYFRESKITVPDRNIEPAVATTPRIPDISIRHEPEIKGGLRALQQKGLKITDYKENVPKP